MPRDASIRGGERRDGSRREGGWNAVVGWRVGGGSVSEVDQI